MSRIFSPGALTNVNGGIDPYAAWLPIHTGEVLTHFADNLFLTGMVSARPPVSPGGTEAYFTRIGRTTSEIHELNAEIIGGSVQQAEQSYFLDKRPLVTANTFDNIQEMLAQRTYRSEIAQEQGRELARQQEVRAAKLIVKAGRAGVITGTEFPGGGINGAGGAITDANFDSADPQIAAMAVCKAIDRWVVRRDEQNHPPLETYCVVKPSVWHGFYNFNNVIYVAADISKTVAANATGLNPFGVDLQRRMLQTDYFMYKGVKIYQSNFIPSTNTSATEDTQTYGGDFTKTRGMIWSPESVAMVMLMQVKTEAWRTPSRQTDTLMASTMTGGGGLRVEFACELAIP
jgi:hypothetical protein